MKAFVFFSFVLFALFLTNEGCAQSKGKYPDPPVANSKTAYPMKLADSQWRARLTPTQYYILRQAGTEELFSG